MKKLNYEKLNAFIASDVIQPFYKIRLERLLYIKKINEMIKDIVDIFYVKDNLNWDKIIEYVSKK